MKKSRDPKLPTFQNEHAQEIMGRIVAGECSNYVIVASHSDGDIEMAASKRWEGLGLVEFARKTLRAQ